MTKERRLYVKVMYSYDSTSQKSGNEMLQAKVVVKNVFNVHYFFSENPTLYVEKYGKARQATNYNIIRRMRFECRIAKSTDTHNIIVFPR